MQPARARKKARQPDPTWMDDLLQMGGIHLNQSQLHKLWQFHQFLRKQNVDRDLTRISGFENMVIKHYVDSMLPLELTEFPAKILDIGSGAGFPGIPIKILEPDIHVILAEHRPRRVQFLRNACQNLKLKEVGIFSHKVTSESFKIPVPGVISRALEDIAKTLNRVEPFLEPQGKVFFWKGPKVDAEMKEINGDFPYQLVLDESYQLPVIHHERRLVVYQKQ